MNGHPASLAAPESEDERIRYLGDLQRLVLKPDDVLVLTVDRPLDAHAAEVIRRMLLEALPDGQRVLVLERGMEVTAVECPAH